MTTKYETNNGILMFQFLLGKVQRDPADECLETTPEFTPPNLDCFNCESEVIESNITDIFAELKALDKRLSNKKILPIFNLKYKENLSMLFIKNKKEAFTHLFLKLDFLFAN